MAYIGNSPDSIQRGRRFIYEFTASAGQTVFSGTDDNNQTLDLLEANEQSVFLNGVRLIPTDDYTVSGDVLTLTSAASLNDFLVVETQAEIVNISTYTRAESDARYVNYNGDIISGDLQVVGNVSVSSGNISLGDNDKINIGASNDLQIYHDGTNSQISTLTGQLFLGSVNSNTWVKGGEAGILNAAGTEYMIRATSNSSVKLFYDNVQKFATSSTGVDITGTLTSDGLTVENTGEVTGTIRSTSTSGARQATLRLNVASTGGDDPAGKVQFTYGTGYSVAGSIEMSHSNPNMKFATGTTERMRIASNGDISFYEDTGTTAKFFWDASAESLGIGTNSPATQASVQNASTSLGLEIDTTSGFASGPTLRGYYRAGTAYKPIAMSGSTVHFGINDVEKMQIDSSGNLLVGTTSYNSSVDGFGASSSGGPVYATATAQRVQILNRRSSDGEILNFRKDNTTVGSIETITASGVALQVKGAVNAQPVDIVTKNSGGSDITYRFHDSLGFYGPDATQNLGRSTARWKDLYLSGGVYVGGTGAANYLDDYEEGTWTPTFGSNSGGPNSGAVYSAQVGTYAKIGNRVICNFKITTTSKGTIGGSTARIFGWPFNSSATSITGKVAFDNVGVSAVDWRPRGMYGSPLLTLDYKTSASGNYVEAAATTFWTDTSSCWGYVSYFIS